MPRYAFHARFTAQPGRADALTEILLGAAEHLRSNDDCLMYVVSRSPEHTDLITVMELWTTRAAHDASLDQDSARESIAAAWPLISGVSGTELRPVGGKGLDTLSR